MLVVSADFETWNIDPIQRGIWAYLVNLRILMMAWHISGDPSPPKLWRPPMAFPAEITAALNAGAKLSGWNSMQFERLVWKHCAIRDHGLRHRCRRYRTEG
jgi:hypothetical protein